MATIDASIEERDAALRASIIFNAAGQRASTYIISRFVEGLSPPFVTDWMPDLPEPFGADMFVRAINIVNELHGCELMRYDPNASGLK